MSGKTLEYRGVSQTKIKGTQREVPRQCFVRTYIHKSLDMYRTRNIITRLEVVVDSVKDYLLQR